MNIVASAAKLLITQLSALQRPMEDGWLRLAGPAEPVEVIRDRWGVPHIYARSAHDVLFAQGFVHAQERLWQMEFNRRLVAGRLAEILGPVAVPVDRWQRTLGMRRVAEVEARQLAGPMRDDLDAYVAGVNAWIAQRRRPVEFALLRHEPEPWSAVDTLQWIKMMAWSLSVNWETELLRARLIAHLGPERAAELEPDWRPGYPYVVPEGVDYSGIGASAVRRAEAARPFAGPSAYDGLGSNNWVLSGARTTTGRPLLANDPHLQLTLPAIWFENHLVGGELNVTGFSFPGLPGVVIGHSAHVAWGFTNGFPDVQDLYIERLRRDAGRVLYEFKGEWLEADVRHEVIDVKGAPPVTEEVVVTRHGPIINGLAPDLAGDQPLALRWTALEPDTMISGLRSLSLARNCDEFREALRHWNAPVQNIVYADTDGNIGYSFPGRVPIRAKGDGRVPVPGWSGEYEWTGYVPYDELPHLVNPPEGFILSANNRAVRGDYPHVVGYDTCMGDRAQRIRELIHSRDQIDADFVRRMHFDQISPTARVLAGHLGRLAVDEPDLKAVVVLMRGWDGHLAPDSAAAAVHEVFLRQMIEATLGDKLGPALDLRERYAGRGPTPLLADVSLFRERAWEWIQAAMEQPDSHWFDQGRGETRDEIMRRALRATVDYLKAELGPEMGDWAWGRLHRVRFSHPLGQAAPLRQALSRGPFPIGGDGTTIWAAFNAQVDLKTEAITGPAFRMIADVGEWANSLTVLTPGQSGHPASPHFDDQIAAWFSGGYHPQLFARAEVEQHARARLRLEPRQAAIPSAGAEF